MRSSHKSEAPTPWNPRRQHVTHGGGVPDLLFHTIETRGRGIGCPSPLPGLLTPSHTTLLVPLGHPWVGGRRGRSLAGCRAREACEEKMSLECILTSDGMDKNALTSGKKMCTGSSKKKTLYFEEEFDTENRMHASVGGAHVSRGPAVGRWGPSSSEEQRGSSSTKRSRKTSSVAS